MSWLWLGVAVVGVLLASWQTVLIISKGYLVGIGTLLASNGIAAAFCALIAWAAWSLPSRRWARVSVGLMSLLWMLYWLLFSAEFGPASLVLVLPMEAIGLYSLATLAAT